VSGNEFTRADKAFGGEAGLHGLPKNSMPSSSEGARLQPCRLILVLVQARRAVRPTSRPLDFVVPQRTTALQQCQVNKG
jgi:hypothetical protein